VTVVVLVLLQALTVYIAAQKTATCPKDFCGSDLIEFLRATKPSKPLAVAGFES
jgi:hypothetical protein